MIPVSNLSPVRFGYIVALPTYQDYAVPVLTGNNYKEEPLSDDEIGNTVIPQLKKIISSKLPFLNGVQPSKEAIKTHFKKYVKADEYSPEYEMSVFTAYQKASSDPFTFVVKEEK